MGRAFQAKGTASATALRGKPAFMFKDLRGGQLPGWSSGSKETRGRGFALNRGKLRQAQKISLFGNSRGIAIWDRQTVAIYRHVQRDKGKVSFS